MADTMSLYAAVTVSSTAVTLGKTAAELQADRPKTEAVITVETDSVRYRSDGTNPTATEGHKIDAGDTLVLRGIGLIAATKFIRVTGDATLRVSFNPQNW